MNTRLLNRIEICVLDLIIDLLSKRYSLHAVFTDISGVIKHKPLFISSIILGSSCVGMAAGYFCFVMTSLTR
jgi:hypothetical protein